MSKIYFDNLSMSVVFSRLARVRGWSEEEHSERTRELLSIEKGDALCRSVVKKGCILHIPASYYPRDTP